MKTKLSLLPLLLAALCACRVAETPDGWNNGSETTVLPMNNTSTAFTLTGIVWGPGADQPYILPANRFPLSGALVAAYPYMQDPPPEERFYCLERIMIPGDIPFVRTETDGSFSLTLAPERDYFLVIQKGMFRRVTKFRSGLAGETLSLEPVTAFAPRRPITTMPTTHDPDAGTWIPRILIIVGRGELYMDTTFEALGFIPDVDF